MRNLKYYNDLLELGQCFTAIMISILKASELTLLMKCN